MRANFELYEVTSLLLLLLIYCYRFTALLKPNDPKYWLELTINVIEGFVSLIS